MNILFHLHAYPLEVMAGAETMAHRIAKYLVSVGHSVKVYSQTAKARKFLDKVEVIPYSKEFNDDAEWKWADLVFTHLGATDYCLNKSRYHKKKLVHLIHNSFGHDIVRCRLNNNYIVYNSEYVKRLLKYEHPFSTICIPPVDYREYEKVKSTGEYVTLINLNENKGGKILPQLARMLPKYKFLGVEGGYYEQHKEKVNNLTYWPVQHDIKKVYEKSKIVLILSQYESYGQVAIEAISCGIPVISTKTQGVVEALGYAGISLDRNNLEDWASMITCLMENKDVYENMSNLAKKRAKELDPVKYLEGLNRFLIDINKRPWEQT